MRTFLLTVLSFIIFHLSFSPAGAQVFVELNCENLFDTRHDEGKNDTEFTPEGTRRWNASRYWHKLNAIAQELLACSEQLPELVALVEVENDSTMRDLTRRSLLRAAGYEYLMTCSPDLRGLDIALLYQPMSFRPICYDYITVATLEDMRPTRDILYVRGRTVNADTLHLFIVHAPSRYGGELETRPHRRQTMNALLQALDSLDNRNVIVAGDFNDYADSPSLQMLAQHGLHNVTANAKGVNKRAKGTYRYQGEWQSIDHILVSTPLLNRVESTYINDAPFLLERETSYGGWKPRRTYQGFTYQRDGYSDHLPLVMKLLGGKGTFRSEKE